MIIETVPPIPKEAFEAVGQDILHQVAKLALPIINTAVDHMAELKTVGSIAAPAAVGFLLGLTRAWPIAIAVEAAGIAISFPADRPEIRTACFIAAMTTTLTGIYRNTAVRPARSHRLTQKEFREKIKAEAIENLNQ